MKPMDSSKIPTKEELYASGVDYLQRSYAEIPLAPYPMRVWRSIEFHELSAALDAPDKPTAREHFQKSAEAAKVIFDFIWENKWEDKESMETLKKALDVPPSSSLEVLESLQAAFAAKEFELAKQIAEKSDLPWHKQWSHGQAHRYALALRKLILQNDYSGFKEIKLEKGILTWGYLGEIWRAVESDPKKALEMVEVLSQKADEFAKRPDCMGYQIWQSAVPAIRNWVALKYPDLV